MNNKKYSCPCCGYKVFTNPCPGSYDICPICYWEDDQLGYENPLEVQGCNGVSLKAAQENFDNFGACSEDMKVYVRKPKEKELKGKRKEVT